MVSKRSTRPPFPCFVLPSSLTYCKSSFLLNIGRDCREAIKESPLTPPRTSPVRCVGAWSRSPCSAVFVIAIRYLFETVVIMSKRKCKFTEVLRAEYPCFTSGQDDFYAKCSICDCHVDVGNKGTIALETHVAKKNIRAAGSSSKVTLFLSTFYFIDSQKFPYCRRKTSLPYGKASSVIQFYGMYSELNKKNVCRFRNGKKS
ncbi:hypothetical protein CHS0354_020465 [Potamilus streckersoni]|uniref:Uncharacterized protein n=1 Tax=Potamilus streckersoni TaxID=2493646 RepID=A0AAE0WAF0_9BIVA|nr:hypothetical protein CHS0354_020465 [Potamilus streckersoni]